MGSWCISSLAVDHLEAITAQLCRRKREALIGWRACVVPQAGIVASVTSGVSVNPRMCAWHRQRCCTPSTPPANFATECVCGAYSSALRSHTWLPVAKVLCARAVHAASRLHLSLGLDRNMDGWDRSRS